MFKVKKEAEEEIKEKMWLHLANRGEELITDRIQFCCNDAGRRMAVNGLLWGHDENRSSGRGE